MRLFLTTYDQSSAFGRAFVFAKDEDEAKRILRLRRMKEKIVNEEKDDVRVANWRFIKNGTPAKQLQYLNWLAFASVRSGIGCFTDVYGTTNFELETPDNYIGSVKRGQTINIVEGHYLPGWLYDYTSLICLPDAPAGRSQDDLDKIIFDIEYTLGLDYPRDNIQS